MQTSLRKTYQLLFVSAAILLAPTGAQAADVSCDVGTAVEGDEIAGGETGEIVEIGTERPHVGWYKIRFPFNPRGDWYDPRYVVIHPAGASDRCVVKKAAPAPASRPVVAPPRNTPPEPVAAPASAVAPVFTGDTKSTPRCQAGRRVVDRQQQAGIVAGENNGLCVVQLDGGGSKSYLNWMLSDAGKPGDKAGVPAGSYNCSAGAAGNFPIQIRSGSAYVDRSGKSGSYRVDAASGKIVFASGSLRGYHSKVLGPGKFGLSSSSPTFFTTVCNRQA